MKKITLHSVNIDCYLQNATEITNEECHEGVIIKDKKGHLRFEEKACPLRTWERNPHIYEGKAINMARKKDGTIKFHFKNVNTRAKNFTAGDYAFQVYIELINALQIID